MRPVEAYLTVLVQELRAVRQLLPAGLKMARLHLGGGTPTILLPEAMDRLLTEVFATFSGADDLEFSVEIDPTEAAPELLETLAGFGLNRASIGVQDFTQQVQNAIGRQQSFVQTQSVITKLRALGVPNINLDLLYGLPHQTQGSFANTLDRVLALDPDRLAIYGYAHVPWMSKRQVMIKEENLPDTHARFDLAEMAAGVFSQAGYLPIGIDHFALSTDGLAQAASAGRLRRNFQGYTDDTAPTLIGFGASAISRFAQGYVQNAPATSAYLERIAQGGLAGHNGYAMRDVDLMVARVIEELMCSFSFNEEQLVAEFPDNRLVIHELGVSLMRKFADVFDIVQGGLRLREDARPLVRIIASCVDDFVSEETAHASAI